MSRLALLAALLPGVAVAQESRYELGQRLRAFEVEWDRVTDATARQRVVPHLKRATTAFFTFSLEEAARGLDRARYSLASDKDTDADVLWAESCVFRPALRLVLTGDDLPFALQQFYRPKSALPEDLRLTLSLPMRVGNQYPVLDLPLKKTLSLKGLPEGDYPLTARIQRAGKVLATSIQTLSVVDRLKERLAKIEQSVAAFADRKTTDSLTAASLATLLKRLGAGQTQETNYPAAALLSQAEELLKALGENKQYHGKDRAGQFWLDLAPGRLPVRVQVPAAAKAGKPLPLVIALHGAGGSENMFFDGYGNGAVAQLCAERGWLLAATRNGLGTGVIDELARLYPLDRKKVFLIGHSMGAAQAVGAASKDPEQFAAVAALGGGGSVQATDGIRKVAFFVGIGKEDFALRGARALKAGLEKAQVEKVTYKEYDNIEHLVIVQLCLPEVFKLFDAVAKR